MLTDECTEKLIRNLVIEVKSIVHCVHASHPGTPIRCHWQYRCHCCRHHSRRLATVTLTPASRRATNGTPANNMAKDYLMRTFRFILLLN